MNCALTGNTDVVLGTELHNYFDLLNISNGGTYIPPVGGKSWGTVILPMNYLNNISIIPIGAQPDYEHNEYNKIRFSLMDDTKVQPGTFATFSLYFYIE